MANCIIAFPNYVDATYYTVAFSGGSWQASLPLTNLKDPLLSKVSRSTSASLDNAQFDVDLGADRDVRLIAIPKHNISRLGKVRVRGSTSASFATSVLDTGWRDVWQVVYPFGTLPYGHPSWWDGKLSAEDAQWAVIPFVYVHSAAVVARYWRVEIDDTANAAGYIELTRLFLSPGWQPTRNLAYGNQLGWETETKSGLSLGGARFYDVRPARRVIRFSVNHLDVDEALAWPFDMQQRLQVSTQVYFLFNPDDTAHLHRRAFLGTLRTLSPLEFPFHDINHAAFEIEEVIA